MNKEIKLRKKSPLKYILIVVAFICAIAFLLTRNDLKASGETSKNIVTNENIQIKDDNNKNTDNKESDNSFRTETKPSAESKDSNAKGNAGSKTDSNNSNTNTNNQPSNNTNNQNTKPVESNNKPTGHYETRTEVIPAWDEKVLVKEGYYETVLVKEAYDEKQTYCLIFGYDKIHVFICGQCGHQASSYDAINAHFDSSESCGSYSEQDIDTGEAHCLSYGEDIIHHDAVYEKIYHEPEYTNIHHPEEIKEYQIWVND